MATEDASKDNLQVTFAKGTDTGRSRDHNEDYVDAFSPSDYEQRHLKGDLFIVADGMGGHQAGEVASENAVRVVAREYYADAEQDVRAGLAAAIRKANAYIYEQAQHVAARAGMGTTVVAAVVRGRELYLANVGDSRAYLMRHGEVQQVTRDHSFVEEQVQAGLLTREEARNHPQRNVITRALGPKPEVQADTYKGELQEGDALLLCSDGLSEYVTEEDMRQVLGEREPEQAVPRLIALANKRGGSDNITALVVRAQPMAGGVDTEPATTAVLRPGGATAGKRAFPVIAAFGAVALLLAGVAAAVLVFVVPRLGEEAATTPLPPGTVEPIPTETVTAEMPTDTPTEAASTATPQVSFELIEPGAGAAAGTDEGISFRWRWVGELPNPFVFLVNSVERELCRSDQDSCFLTLEEGVYEWWVELHADDQVLWESDHRNLTVRPAATTAPSVVLTPTVSLPLSASATLTSFGN